MDTSFWVALIHSRDQFHSQAPSTWERAGIQDWPIITTNWTLYETITLLNCSYCRHDMAIQALDFVSRLSEIVHIEASQIEGRTLEIFQNHPDLRWSVVDCANFACIELRQCEFALSYDRNFQQAHSEFGFRLLAP